MSERLSGTVTFLFTDIEGSTSLLKQLGRARYGELLAQQQDLLREQFKAHNGEEIDTQGDSFFVAFRSASDAVAAAVAIEKELTDHEWPEGVQVLVRIGIHSGEAAAARERYVGFSVHRAARIGNAAHGGQVLLSDATRVLVEDDLPEGVFLRDLGYWRLKDVDRPERVSQVAAEGFRTEFPPLRSAERIAARPVTRRHTLLAAALIGAIAAAVAIPVFALGGSSSGTVALHRVEADSLGVVDPSSGRIAASIGVESGPSSVAYGLGSVWVANTNDNTVSRINPQTSAVEQTIGAGNGPAGVAVGHAKIWVANSLDGTVSEIDPLVAGGRVVGDPIQVGDDPTGIAFGLGRVWVANSSDRTVVPIDPASGKVGKAIQVADGADAVAVGDGAVWVVSQSAGVLSRVDPGTGSVQPINVGRGPVAVAVGAHGVWVANSLDGTVSEVDPSTNTVTGLKVGQGPTGVAVTPDGTSVWVTDGEGGTLLRIDTVKGKVTKTVVTGNQPTALALSADATYVTVAASGKEHRGGTFTVATSGAGRYEASLLDPADLNGDWTMLINTNDGLMAYRRVGGSGGEQLVPDLALSTPIPTDGGRTYTFQVHSGIRYSNGALVRPADFRRAIVRELSLSSAYQPSYYTDIVGGAACLKHPARCDLSRGIVTDPRSNTVTFHLAKPDPEFLYKLALPPADAVPANTPVQARLPLPATGPYMVASYSPTRIRLVRNPRFREWSAEAQPDGYPDAIVETSLKSQSADIKAVEHGTADYTIVNGVEGAWRTEYAAQVHNSPGLDTLYVTANTRLAPFNDVRVRQAISYAIDRRRVIKLLGGVDTARLSCQLLPPNLAGYVRYCPYTIDPTPDGQYHGPDPAKARQLVKASGTTGMTIVDHGGRGYFNTDPMEAYFVSVLRSLGYKVRVKLDPPPVWFANTSNTRRGYQTAGFINWQTDYPSPAGFFLPLISCSYFRPGTSYGNGNANTAEFCDHHIDAMINSARALQADNPRAATAVWARIDHKVVDEAVAVGVSNTIHSRFVSHRVGNYQYSPQWGALYDQMWVK
jgi:peptide/nickel transport system substrate-binding protein